MLILFFIILPFLFPFFAEQKPNDHTEFENAIAQLNIKQQDSTGSYANRDFDESNYQRFYQPSERNNYSKQAKGELFYFDPNTLTVEGWMKLGVREKTANTIKNYISKGGKFYKPEDIGKIWGLHEDLVKRLLPYVKIEIKTETKYVSDKTSEQYKIYEKPKPVINTVDINAADTAALIALPGIGSKLAGRIVAFRDKLGGFYKTEQVAETFALPDSTFQKIKGRLVINNDNVQKININKATLDELKTHPYIRYNIANIIVQYRNMHGNFATVDDLKKIMIITDEIYNKVSPYLSVK